jgi:pimeloyl-ACP methyl ester carboxylesterase
MRVAGVYLVLLTASWVVRSRRNVPADSDPSRHVATVNAVQGSVVIGRPVRIAFRDCLSAGREGAPVILLIHGSPGRKEDFDQLTPTLGASYRVVVPDLPGFGASERTLPDYSFRAHAIYLDQLLRHLGISRVHVVGYSMGGGVALSLASAAPDRVASLTMVSAVGVQEMELTGDYHLNHLVHAVQLVAVWALREGTPHMGALDNRMLGVAYARNFFDSDQRPLRGVLRELKAPTLIVHGRADGQVPVEAAREHARLVPQSEIVEVEGDHFLVFNQPSLVTRLLSDFVGRVERGEAATRSEAGTKRSRAATPMFGPEPLPRSRGIAAGVYALVLTGATITSESVGAASAGALVARGRVSPLLSWMACFAGLTIAGLGSGLRAIRRSGAAAGSRFPRAGGWPTALATFGVSALWLTGIVSLAAVMSRVFKAAPLGDGPHRPSILWSVGALALALILSRRVLTFKGRRLMVSSWRRLTRWEFWPPSLFYPPLLLYIAYLMAKYRSVTLFTAANPAIVAGGFVGESKFAILMGLSAAGGSVARAHLLDGSASLAQKLLSVRRFMADNAITLPIVLKPDQGQRGSGVVVVRSAAALERCLAHSSVDTIAQEYVAGREFGVFYYRRPTETSGQIFSITEKRFPTVTGDGQRTLEELILADDRAVCAARLYCERLQTRLSEVPARGESISLVELGTHCRGAMFLDGGSYRTSALAERFDSIARTFDGFFFGRFDVRVEGSDEEFRSGVGFKVIELNGVTSEATHIYQPGTPLTAAYRVLMHQWRIAFEIGAENRRRGLQGASLGDLVRLLRKYLQMSRHHLPSDAGSVTADFRGVRRSEA